MKANPRIIEPFLHLLRHREGMRRRRFRMVEGQDHSGPNAKPRVLPSTNWFMFPAKAFPSRGWA